MADPDIDSDSQVAPEEVQAYLRKEQWKGADTEVLVEAELTEEERDTILGKRSTTHHESNLPTKGEPVAREDGKEEPELPMNPMFNRETPNLENQLWQTLINGEYTKIEVTETERVIYFRSMIMDTACKFDIVLNYGENVPVQIKNCSNFELNVVKTALDLADKEGKIGTQSELFTLAQYYMAAVRWIGFNEQPVEAFKCDTDASIEQNAQNLRTFAQAKILPINGAKWGAILTALMVYEAKIRACGDAALKKNSSATAGAVSS